MQTMGQLGIDPIKLFADGLALVYHEARNVRHLIHEGHLPASQWQRLVSRLPKNRRDAWKQLQPARQAARTERSAKEAAEVFANRFGKNLDDLVELFQNPNWKHAEAYGGHAWILIATTVAGLGRFIDQGKSILVYEACTKLINACHNTGRLCDKVLELDGEIGAAPEHGSFYSSQLSK